MLKTSAKKQSKCSGFAFDQENAAAVHRPLRAGSLCHDGRFVGRAKLRPPSGGQKKSRRNWIAVPTACSTGCVLRTPPAPATAAGKYFGKKPSQLIADPVSFGKLKAVNERIARVGGNANAASNNSRLCKKTLAVCACWHRVTVFF